MDSPLMRSHADRLEEKDVSFRTHMLEIAEGLDDVIAMGRGDPDFHTPTHIVDAAKRAIDEHQHHYTHPAGITPLREAIAHKLRRDNALDYGADEIIVTSGAQEALMLCMLALVNPGDEVLLPSPRFTSYDTAVKLCGGKVVPVRTKQEDDFALMPEELEQHITSRTKVLVLVTPNNPTGAVTPPDVVREIAALATKHDLIVLSDEIYEKLIYDGNVHLSIASLPGMKERTITLNGFSKAYAMTGWRVGYLAAPAPFVRLLIEPRHTLSINASTPSQYAALAALSGPQDPILEMLNEYDRRRRLVMGELDAMGLSYGHPGGAFYVYVNVSSTGMSSPEFCERLLREARVMMFPGTLFGDENEEHVRLGYLQPLGRIKEAMNRMAQALTAA